MQIGPSHHRENNCATLTSIAGECAPAKDQRRRRTQTRYGQMTHVEPLKQARHVLYPESTTSLFAQLRRPALHPRGWLAFAGRCVP